MIESNQGSHHEICVTSVTYHMHLPQTPQPRCHKTIIGQLSSSGSGPGQYKVGVKLTIRLKLELQNLELSYTTVLAVKKQL